MLRFFEANGLAYAGHPERNVVVPTAVGTLKTTYRVPRTMWQGVEAWERRAPCLLVDIQGLKGFSARQIAETLGARLAGPPDGAGRVSGHARGERGLCGAPGPLP